MVQKLSRYHVINTPWNFTVHACLHGYMHLYKWKSVIVSFLCLYNIYTCTCNYISVIHVIPKHSTHSTKQCGFGYFRSTLDDTGHITGAGKPSGSCRWLLGKDWDKVPVIGKVLEVSESMVKIHYWKGSFEGKWSLQDVPRRRTPRIDELPKTCIILCSFLLSEDSKQYCHLPENISKMSMLNYNRKISIACNITVNDQLSAAAHISLQRIYHC